MVSIPVPGRAVKPLSQVELDKCAQMARRVQQVLLDLFKALPEHARSATGMSRHLEIVRNTCQRIVTGLSDDTPSAATLVKLPGIEGLRHFIRAVESRGADRTDVATADATIELLHGLFRELGGSQLRLVDRLKATALDPGAGESRLEADERARQAHFNASSMLANSYCDAVVDVSLYHAFVDGNNVHRERISATGYVNRVARPGAAPLAIYTAVRRTDTGMPQGEARLLDQSVPGGIMPAALLPQFSTSPMPMATTRAGTGELRTVIDSKAANSGRPMTVVGSSRLISEVPLSEKKPTPPKDNWVEIATPARRLVMDIYMHRDIAAMCVPSMEVLLTYPPTILRDRWCATLSNPPRLELLGLGLERSGSTAFAQHAALTAHLFEQSGWNPHDFVGYRCDTTFPIWLAHYNFNTHFNEPRPAAEPEPHG
jgi:hypothetical protein